MKDSEYKKYICYRCYTITRKYLMADSRKCKSIKQCRCGSTTFFSGG